MDDDTLIPEPPRRHDVLLSTSLSDWWNNACLNVMPGGDQHGYTEGYRRGARLLVEHVNENARDQDYLVYPIIFLYRHHIELALKNLVTRVADWLDHVLTETEQRHLNGHRLDLLWNDLKPLLDAMCAAKGWNKLPAAETEGVDSHIRQFHALDPYSFNFRYTHTKTGEASLPPELKAINLRHFAETLERCAEYLDTLDFGIGILDDEKSEAAYFQSEMEAHWG